MPIVNARGDNSPGSIETPLVNFNPNGANATTVSGNPIEDLATQADQSDPGVNVQPTVPGAPIMRKAVAIGNFQIRVDFKPPRSNGGSPITGYKVTDETNGVTVQVSGPPAVMNCALS